METLYNHIQASYTDGYEGYKGLPLNILSKQMKIGEFA